MKWTSKGLVLASLALLAVATAACAGLSQGGKNPETPSPADATPAGEGLPTPPRGLVAVPTQPSAGAGAIEPQPVDPNAFGDNANRLVEQAKADLANRLGIKAEQLVLVSMDQVTWNDGSLGCPKPGEYYTQSLVPGFQITLSYQGQSYDYHTDASNAILCERPLQGGAVATLNLMPELKLINLAMVDLAQRLGIATSTITYDPLTLKTWPDASLGCPEAGQTYTPAETKGYEIILKVDGKPYVYHTDFTRVVYCPLQ